METIGLSKFPSVITKSPSMLSSRKVSSKTINSKKTRNDNLKSKLQKSLNIFIKNHQTTITLSGSKRFSDKSGVYYLKNKSSKEGIDNSLTPIPMINNKKINSHYEKNSLSKAERTAVYLRRMEYSSGISNSKMIEKKNKERNRKIIYIQQWWRMMFKLIFIQKNIKGFLFRKKLFEHLERQAKIINHLWMIKCSREKQIIRKHFRLFKFLLIQDIILMKFISRRVYRIKQRILKTRFVYWKEYRMRSKLSILIKKIYKYIMKGIIKKIKKTNKYIYNPVTARYSRRQLSCELICSNTITMSSKDTNTRMIKQVESSKKLFTEKKKALIDHNRMSYATSNISMNISFEDLIEKKAEKIVVSKKLYQTNKKKKKTTVYTNQISSQKKENQSVKVYSCKKALQFNQLFFDNLEMISNLCDKQRGIKKYKQCLMKKYLTIWKNNKRVIRKQNSAIIYYSKKNLLRQRYKRKNKSINIQLYFAFVEWKKNKIPKFNINSLVLIHHLIIYQRAQKKAFRNQRLQYCLQIITNILVKRVLTNWRRREPIKVFKKKNVFMKTKSAIDFPNLDFMNDSSMTITLPSRGIYSSKKVNSFRISQSQSNLNPNSSCNTIDLTSLEDRPSILYSKTNSNVWNCPNPPLYKKKILNVNYNFTNTNNYTTIDFDTEDRDNYMNNTFTLDSRYNAMNTNTTSTNITCHDTSSFYLKDVPTIKTKIIRFKKKY